LPDSRQTTSLKSIDTQNGGILKDCRAPIHDIVFRENFSNIIVHKVLVQILLSVCFYLARGLQILSGQDRGPNFRSGGYFYG